jgi:hypothetical protein
MQISMYLDEMVPLGRRIIWWRGGSHKFWTFLNLDLVWVYTFVRVKNEKGNSRACILENMQTILVRETRFF